MNPVHKIKSLYHRFIKGSEYDGKIEPQDLAIELERAGLIDLKGHPKQPLIDAYRDSESFSASMPAEQKDRVRRIMAGMRGKDGL